MLARRNRALIRPNIGKAAAASRKEPTPSSLQPSSEGAAESTSNSGPETLETSNNAESLPVPIAQETEGARDTSSNEKVVFAVPRPLSPQKSLSIDPLAPPRRIAHASHHVLSPRQRHLSTYEPEKPPPVKRRFTGDETLDPKSMRMMDLIRWNPKKEKGMTRKDRDMRGTSVSVSELDVSERDGNQSAQQQKNSAPQFKLGEDGSLILDESSLLIPEAVTETSVWDLVDEDRLTHRVTSLSFRNRLWRKGSAWTEKETELFYEILRCTGPDFGLMHEFFPARARSELKSKFNREEKRNWERMKQILGEPAILDDSLYEKAAKISGEIEKEALAKKQKKEKRPPATPKDKTVAVKNVPAVVDWDEENANLEKEAEAVIRDMQKEDERLERARRGSNDSNSSSCSDSEDEDFIVKKKKNNTAAFRKRQNAAKIRKAKDVNSDESSNKRTTKLSSRATKILEKAASKHKAQGYEEDVVNSSPIEGDSALDVVVAETEVLNAETDTDFASSTLESTNRQIGEVPKSAGRKVAGGAVINALRQMARRGSSARFAKKRELKAASSTATSSSQAESSEAVVKESVSTSSASTASASTSSETVDVVQATPTTSTDTVAPATVSSTELDTGESDIDNSSAAKSNESAGESSDAVTTPATPMLMQLMKRANISRQSSTSTENPTNAHNEASEDSATTSVEEESLESEEPNTRGRGVRGRGRGRGAGRGLRGARAGPNISKAGKRSKQ